RTARPARHRRRPSPRPAPRASRPRAGREAGRSGRRRSLPPRRRSGGGGSPTHRRSTAGPARLAHTTAARAIGTPMASRPAARVCHGGELVLIASIQCHHADTGGGMPGGYNADAPDIWAEGVRFPALKLYERGVERRDLTYFMRVNNRTPTFLGDLRAQVGAAQLGVRRLQE